MAVDTTLLHQHYADYNTYSEAAAAADTTPVDESTFNTAQDSVSVTDSLPNDIAASIVGSGLAALENVNAKIAQDLAAAIRSGASEATPDAGVNKLLSKAEAAYDKIASIAQEQASGVIPEDVLAQIKINVAEQSALSGAVGSRQVGRLTARDFGLKSLDLQAQGQAGLATAAQGYAGVASAREAMREFNASFQQNAQQLENATRQTLLTGTEMGLNYALNKAKMTMEVNTQIASLTNLQEQLRYQYSVVDKADVFAAANESIQHLIDQFSATVAPEGTGV